LSKSLYTSAGVAVEGFGPNATLALCSQTRQVAFALTIQRELAAGAEFAVTERAMAAAKTAMRVGVGAASIG
jgi:hypothetical protein